MSYLYILEINPLLVALIANIFSHSIAFLLILLMVYFDVQSFLIPFRSYLFLLLFLLPWDIVMTYVRDCFCLCSLLVVLWCHVLHLSLQTIFSLFSYIV